YAVAALCLIIGPAESAVGGSTAATSPPDTSGGLATAEPAGQVTGAVVPPPHLGSLPPGSSATPTGTLPPSVPVRLRIRSIGVDSPLMALGIAADGSLEVPPAGFPAGWYTGAPTPGERGPAVVAGHVDWNGRAGVFFELHAVRAGDLVEVSRADGSVATFRVTRVARFPKNAFPTSLVYGDIDHAGLRLITCGGPFDRAAASYVDDVVVFADLI
ncbi:MAG: hypothetical protein QOI42_1717, partial [Frankiaceae bacterium]|nr:hypothetical protein [Frankiaceae bacterium]